MPDIHHILSRFPKRRPPLPEAQQAIYEQEYLANRGGQTLMTRAAQALEAWMHRTVAHYARGARILEIGAGTLNQLPYMQGAITRYDAVEPAAFFYESSPHIDRVHQIYNDIDDCSERYDNIISVAALEHIEKLPHVIAKSGLILETGGACVHAIPCEGGLAWGAAWRLSTGLAYKLRTGFSYTALMRHEHVNDYDEIVALHRYFFEEVHLRFFPLPGKHLALFCAIVARSPKLDRCADYASARQ